MNRVAAQTWKGLPARDGPERAWVVAARLIATALPHRRWAASARSKIGQCGLDGRVAVDLPVQCHAKPGACFAG